MISIFYGFEDFWNFTPNMSQRPLLDAKFSSLFFSFCRARELSNEPHIVWVLRTFNNLPQICPNVHFWTQTFFHYFFRLVGLKSFRMSPILCGFRRLLTFNPKYAQSSTFGRKIFFHYFFRFLGPKSFQMSPILYGLDEFWHLTPNMPKRPLSDKKIFNYFFGIFELKEEFWAIRRLSATSVSLSNPKTALDQSEAVKSLLGGLNLK